MSFFDYLYEKLSLLFVHIFSALALVIFLKLLEISNSAVAMILLSWLVIVSICMVANFLGINKKQKAILRLLEGMDQKYLISEVMDKPTTQWEKIYFILLREGSKSMLEEVGKSRDGQSSYKEYIEKWIHEIKTPITAISLICANNKTEETKRISQELQQIYYLVEQTLYYARSETVEQDYFIKQIRLFDVVQSVIVQQKASLIEHKFSVQVEENEDMVWTDEKWLGYILNQIITNAIKYQNEASPCLNIYSNQRKEGIYLSIKDNGIGITEYDLPRIFEKGFTGSDRKNKQATGIGLYLCKKLCDKLGLSISARSNKNAFTEITIFFPIGNLTAEITTGLTKV